MAEVEPASPGPLAAEHLENCSRQPRRPCAWHSQSSRSSPTSQHKDGSVQLQHSERAGPRCDQAWSLGSTERRKKMKAKRVKMWERRTWARKTGNQERRKKRTRPPGKGRQWLRAWTPSQKPLSAQTPFAFLPQQEELALLDTESRATTGTPVREYRGFRSC